MTGRSRSTGTSIFTSSFSLPPTWTSITETIDGGILVGAGGVLAGADGNSVMFADLGVETATSHNLFVGGYTSVSAGDVFDWSFDINSHRLSSTGLLRLDFGGGNIQTLGSGNSVDLNLATFVTHSGSYTATATDAASGSLQVKFSITVGRLAGRFMATTSGSR